MIALPNPLPSTPFVADAPFTYDTIDLDFVYTTGSKTITADAVAAFCEVTGIEGGLFTDLAYARAAGYPAPLVPGALVMSTAEGLVLRSKAFHGSGLALLQATFKARSPVFAGDTIRAIVQTAEARETSNPARGVVTSHITVLNQDDNAVMTFEPVRMIRSAASYEATKL